MAEWTANSRLRLLNDVIFAVYLCLLAIMANSVRSVLHDSVLSSWVWRFLAALRFERPLSYEDSGLRFAFVLLWLGSATSVFLCVRLLSRTSFIRSLLLIVSGIVAVAGFPIASGITSFRGYLGMLGSIPKALLYAYASPRWLGVEMIASLVGVFLYAFSQRFRSFRFGLLLLVLHFALWSWLVILGAGSGNILLWPGYSWIPLTHENPSLIYPLLGLLASAVWLLCVRNASQIQQPSLGSPD